MSASFAAALSLSAYSRNTILLHSGQQSSGRKAMGLVSAIVSSWSGKINTLNILPDLKDGSPSRKWITTWHF